MRTSSVIGWLIVLAALYVTYVAFTGGTINHLVSGFYALILMAVLYITAIIMERVNEQ